MLRSLISCSSTRSWRSVGAGLVLGTVTGCSLLVADVVPCETNTDCRLAFGASSVCGEEGFCARVELVERCDQTMPEDLLTNPEHNDALVFGSMVDRSVVTEIGRERAMQLVVDMANRQGGLDGRTVGLISCDTQDAADSPFSPIKDDELSRTEAAATVARFLIEELELPGIVGPSSSADVELVYSEVVEPAGAVMISPAATSASLTGLDVIPATGDTPGRLWRTAPGSSALAAAMAQDIVDRGIGSVLLMAQQGYGDVMAADIQDGLAASGATVEVSVIPWQIGGLELLDEAIGKASDAEGSYQEVVFLSSYTKDAVRFIETFAEDSAFSGTTAFMADAAGNWDLLRANAVDRYGVTEEADPMDPASVDRYDVRVARYASPSSTTYNAFVTQYKAAYKNEDPTFYNFSAHSHDAMWLMLVGASWADQSAGAINGTLIARGMRRANDKDGGVAFTLEQANWRGIQAQLGGGATLDVEGASGHLDIAFDTEETTGVVEVVVVDKGSGDNYTFIAPPAPPS